MSKNPFPNPDFTPWTSEAQDEYLKYARTTYEHKYGNPLSKCEDWRHFFRKRKNEHCPSCPPPHKPRKQVLEGLYEEGRLRGCLRLPFGEFERWMLRGPRSNWKKFGHHYVKNGKAFKKASSKYRRNPNHAQKKADDRKQDRKDWRKKKGFEQDHRKSNPRHGRGRFRRWAKTESNHLHRRWEDRQIRKGDWDNMISDIRKWTHDPWMWD